MKRLLKLKPRVKLLTDFYVFDTETGIKTKDGIEYTLRARPENFIFGVLYGHNYQKVFHSLEDFKNELLLPRFKGRKIFAHNAEYDLNVLYGSIFDLDPHAIFNGKFISATNGNCTFADSLNIYNSKLEKIGEMLGIKKKTLSFKAKKVTKKAVEYCIRDCVIVYEALIRIFEEAGDIKITQASLSLTYFRRFHQPFTIEHNENTSYFFDSYFGGRCEAFKIGNTHSKVIDINSAYPYAMKNCVFPNPKFLKVEDRPNMKYFFNNVLPHYEGLIYCEVKHEKTYYGYLPIKKENKLVFPVGNFSGCWNFNELRFALQNGAVKINKISKIVYSEPMISPFSSYVDYLYMKRFSSNNPLEIYRVKIFMNSLYGKFAQRIDEENIYLNDYEKQYHLIQDYQRKGLFKKLQLFNEKRKDAFLITKNSRDLSANFSIPSFSSYITSFVRVYLLDKLLSLKNCRVTYCDTDSIFFELDPGFEDEKFLGGWKREDKIVTQIRGLKNYDYFADGKHNERIKGVPKSATKTGANSYEYYNLVKTKEGLRRNIDAGISVKRTKEITAVYNKRIVYESGETEPLIL